MADILSKILFFGASKLLLLFLYRIMLYLGDYLVSLHPKYIVV